MWSDFEDGGRTIPTPVLDADLMTGDSSSSSRFSTKSRGVSESNDQGGSPHGAESGLDLGGEMGWEVCQGRFRYSTDGKCGALRGNVAAVDEEGNWSGMLDLNLEPKLIISKEDREKEQELFQGF
jgi:hypothetical protein